MTRLFSASIRTQLLLIVTILALPAAAIIVYSGFKLRAEAIQEARNETQHLSSVIASEQQNLTDAAEQLLVALAQLPEVQRPDASRIKPILRRILALNARYSNLIIADKAGNIWATAVEVKPHNVSDRRHFKGALASGQLSSGEFLISPVTGKGVLPLAYPYTNEKSEISGVIIVAIDLDYYKKLFSRFELPSGKGYLLLDHQGIILSASGPGISVGTRYNPLAFSNMQNGKDKSTVMEKGMDGRKRFITYRKLQLKSEDSPYLYIRTGIPLSIVLNAIDKSLAFNLTLFTVGLLIALFFAWLLGKRSIVDRISLLEKATRRIAQGDLNITVSSLIGGGELGNLGATFDDMARQLALREKELTGYRDRLEEMVSARTAEISVLNNQLQQSQKLEAVGLLAGGVAHDFRNILATIKGAVYLIQKKLEKESPLIKYADQVSASIAKATNLSDSLLAFSRKQAVDLQPLALNTVIQKTENLLHQVVGEHVELIVQLDAAPSVVLADNNQLEQVLLNMATNARDAMPGGGRLFIHTMNFTMDETFIRTHGYGVAGDYILMEISDSGLGIEDGVKEKVFDPFFTTKGLGKGSGLGLAVTYGIVKQYSGYIVIESEPEQGTTFRIYLPAADATPVEYSPTFHCPPTDGTETLLLAEDDSDTRRTLSEVLSLSGYRVLEAADGAEALAIYTENRHSIDLVFIDVWMPKKNGPEVCRLIRAISPEVRFLFMSGYADDLTDAPDVPEKFRDFISKGARPEEILRKIRNLLDHQVS
ncbi:MAG: hypothetical protein C0402_09535 [Thermodesulfovibrio sp.]|nr:hypothetical protein [Thermodesulfovibrio sp.]